MTGSELVITANRLPVYRVRSKDGSRWETSPGGLVSALASVLQGRKVAWVGWSGTPGTAPDPFEHDGFRLFPLALSQTQISDFYRNFSNRTLWPLYHDAVRTPEFRRRWWRYYREVNERFAEAAAEILAPGGTVWVHDYHLQLVPAMLRALRPDARISFFLHIPFPPIELFAQLPWRRQILEGLLGADLVGFQTQLGAQNFARLARRFTDARGTDEHVTYQDRAIDVEAIPISIDIDRFEKLARSPEMGKRVEVLRRDLGPSRRVLLGVDRLDYTKGIDTRLRAFETLLQWQPHLTDNVVFVQIAVPSREYVPEYEEFRMRIEQRVGRINGSYGEPGRAPVHYLYRNLPTDKLIAHYMAADVMVVTPLRDGMNLVAKEYVACRLDESGVLILSEFTGAAKELTQALRVNPHDVDGVAGALDQALRMPTDEIKQRMKSLKQTVHSNDVFRWARTCLRVHTV